MGNWSIAKNEVFLQMKIERLGSMISGTRCPFYVNGKIKYYTVQHDKDKQTDYIKIDGKRLTADRLPFGEEVTV